MRESVGSTYIFGLAISFTLIFSGFLVLAINYNRAYKIKNEVINNNLKYVASTIGVSSNDEPGTSNG